ncbi:MAG: aspartate/glutamate racemase family protein [Acidimicrobiia bacterium]|nr:aspartate/glutamate racemase family protein [Acidimicrobiia bacterium]
MRRVLVVVPFALDAEGVALRRRQVAAVPLADDIEFDFRPVKAGPTSFVSPHDWTLMDIAIFEAGLSAEDDGYDAVCIDTVSDSGADALRSVLDIPVVSPGRISLLFALTLGSTFGIVAQWEPSLARYRKVIREWGFSEHCAGVEHFDTPPDFSSLIEGKEEMVFPRMIDAGRRLVGGGADVVVLGSTTMAAAHAALEEALDVPVVNPGPLSYKLAETFLEMGLAQSRGAYPRPHTPKPGLVHAMLDGAARHEADAGS